MTAHNRDLRVLFFGDSFVAGTGDPTACGWVGRVVAATWAAGTPMTGYPLGIRRETSVEVAARWWAEAHPRLLAGADCRVVFAFGTNDATFEDGRPRVQSATSVRMLDRVLDEATRLGLPAFVVGPPPSCDAAQDDRIGDLSACFATVCEERSVPFVGVVAALGAGAVWGDEARAGDGVHPGAGGYDALAELVLDGGWPEWLAWAGNVRVPDGFIAHGPASDAEIEAAEQALAVAFPEDYRRFLRRVGGGEGPIGRESYVSLWPAADLAELNAGYRADAEYAPDLVFIGTDGGNEVFAIRPLDGAFVMAPLIGMSADAVEIRGSTFGEFFAGFA